MIRFVLFGKNLFSHSGFDTLKLIFSDVINDPDVNYIPPRATEGEKWVNLWTNKRGFRKWTSVFDVPFKKAAFQNVVSSLRFDKKDEVIFVFFSNEPWYLGEKGFLAYLKDTFPNCKRVYKLLNLVEYVNEDLKDLLSYYDLVIAGDAQDAAQYHLPYCDLGYSKTSFRDNTTPYCDCFYVGASKDRLAEIHSVYRRLSSSGLTCIFYIVGVSKEQQISEKGIIYNTYLDYDIIVKHIQHTRIILEVVQEKQQAPTIRLFESVAYNKILLTNNKALAQSPY